MNISKLKLATVCGAIEVAIATLMVGCNGCNPPVQQLWVADAINNLVLQFSALNPINGIATNANQVIGQPDFVSNGRNFSSGNVNAKGIDSPNGITFDAAGNLWVSDTSNNRGHDRPRPGQLQHPDGGR